jgi:hypothetical protein
MIVLEAFNKLANSFHQDTFLIHKTLDDAIQASVRSLTPAERAAAKSYVDELLNGTYNDQRLAEIWNKSPAGSGGFEIDGEQEGGAMWFLSQLSVALASSLLTAEDR